MKVDILGYGLGLYFGKGEFIAHVLYVSVIGCTEEVGCLKILGYVNVKR